MDAHSPVAHAPDADWRRLRESVGLIEFGGRGILHLAGPDGAEFLQGLVTNDVLRLQTGAGRPAAILTPTGKIYSMLDVWRVAPDALLLALQAGDGGRVVEFLEHYRFGERVEIADLTHEMTWLSLQGPSALAAAAAVHPGAGDLRPQEVRSLPFGERTLRIASRDEIGIPGVHFFLRAASASSLRDALERAAAEAGGGPVSREAWTVCRVEAGVPWMGAELDESVLPMEARLHPILDLEKGCYIGQEVVSRALVQGRSNWGLWGLRLPEGSAMRAGQELRGVEKARPLARVRTVVRSPGWTGLLALAFVHREVARPGAVTFMSESGPVEVMIEELPFALTPEAAGSASDRAGSAEVGGGSLT